MPKILCLHGSFGSAQNFQVQLGAFAAALEKPGVEFKWIDGFVESNPPPGFEDYFGAPPLYRYMAVDGISKLDDVVLKIRDLSNGASPEDTMRLLAAEQQEFERHGAPAVHSAMDKLFQILDEDPEIDGIMGYSEGATTAGTLILEERRRFEEEGRPRHLKFGIFFAGWPPVKIQPDGGVKTILADECEDEDILDIPTCHIVGCNDPYIHGAMALYTMCDEDTAVLFDHGKGHTVPRDQQTINELTQAIERTFAMVEDCC